MYVLVVLCHSDVFVCGPALAEVGLGFALQLSICMNEFIDHDESYWFLFEETKTQSTYIYEEVA